MYEEIKLKPGKYKKKQLYKCNMIMTDYTAVQTSRITADNNFKLTGVNKHVIAEKRLTSYLDT